MKKIISFIMSLVVMSGIHVVSADKEMSASTSSALEIMQVLGFLNSDYSEETIDVNSELTRAEFANTAGEIFNVNNVSGDVLYFHDVPADYYAYDSITYLTSVGAISINGEKKFYPGNRISVTEAAKIVVYALGYGRLAEAHGGYPDGVTRVATDIGLLKNVDSVSGNLSYAGMFRMLYNAVLAKMPELTVDGNLSYDYNGDTFLGVNYDIFFEEGTVTGVNGADYGSVSSNNGQVVINNTVFEADGADYTNHLGYEVEYLYRYDKADDEYTLIWMKNTDKNDCIELSFRENEVSFDRESYKLSYWTENGRAKELSILKSAKVIYNGRLLTSGGMNSVLESNFDTIRLFKSPEGNVYDLLIVYGYENYIVDIIDIENESVYDRVTNRKMDFSEYDEVFIYNTDGSLLEISRIPVGTVLSVYPSWNGEKVSAYVTNSVVEGNVTASVQKNGYLQLTVNDEVYKSYVEHDTVRIGSKVKMWLDINGYVERIDYVPGGAERYAYMINMFSDEDVSEELWFKLFVDSGEVIRYRCSEKVVVDGESYKKSFPLGVYNYFGGKNIEPQLIRFTLNDENEISKIDTVREDSKSDFRCTYEKRGRQYKGGKFIANSAVGSMIIDSSTLVFRVPLSPKDAEDWEFSMVRVSSINDWFSATTEGFSSQKDKFVCDAVIMHGTDMKNGNNPRYLMVNNIKTILNDNAEAVKQIEGYYGSGEYTVITAPECDAEDVKRGDIVYITYDNKGDAAGVDLRYRHGEMNLPAFVYDHSNNYNFFGAYVYDSQSGMLKVSSTKDAQVESDIYKVGTLWIFDSQNREIRKGTTADVIGGKTSGEGTPVIIATSQGYVSTAYAFK